jgi:hypothetical protein
MTTSVKCLCYLCILEDECNYCTLNVYIVSDKWIELAYMNWAEDDEGVVIQINNLMNKFKRILQVAAADGESEIINWLERKKMVILNTRKKEEL